MRYRLCHVSEWHCCPGKQVKKNPHVPTFTQPNAFAIALMAARRPNIVMCHIGPFATRAKSHCYQTRGPSIAVVSRIR